MPFLPSSLPLFFPSVRQRWSRTTTPASIREASSEAVKKPSKMVVIMQGLRGSDCAWKNPWPFLMSPWLKTRHLALYNNLFENTPWKCLISHWCFSSGGSSGCTLSSSMQNCFFQGDFGVWKLQTHSQQEGGCLVDWPRKTRRSSGDSRNYRIVELWQWGVHYGHCGLAITSLEFSTGNLSPTDLVTLPESINCDLKQPRKLQTSCRIPANLVDGFPIKSILWMIS